MFAFDPELHGSADHTPDVPRFQTETLQLVLQAAQVALHALGGAVLLVRDRATLHLVLRQGYPTGLQPLWQDSDLSDPGPAADALRQREPLFFEHTGTLSAAYPDFEARSGGVAAVATAVLPLVAEDRPLGVMVLDFQEPHRFTEDEVRFLRLLAAQTSAALERDSALEAERAALDAVVAYSELVGTETNVTLLAQRAVDTLRVRFGSCSGGYYERVGDRWHLCTWTEDLNARPEFLASLRAGLPSNTPFIHQLLQTRQPSFTEDWNAENERIGGSEEYGTVAAYPVIVSAEVRGFFTLGLKTTARWTERDRAVVRSVGRGLDLALERVEYARELEAQNAELEARNRVLAAFEGWARDLTPGADPDRLIERAEALLLDVLPVNAALYYQRRGEHWYVHSLRGGYGGLDLQQAHEAGLPHAETDNLRIPFETGEPYYQDIYDPTTDHLEDAMQHVRATAIVPLRTALGVRGLLGLGRFDRVGWSDNERAVIETVRRSLELALDRAEGAAVLEARSRALEQANEELEVFNYSVSHDLMTPVRHVAGFADLALRSGDAGPTTRRHLDVIRQAAGRMQTLIEAMLELSRVGRQELRLTVVDLEALVGRARQDLAPDLVGRAIDWRVGDLPQVRGDRDTLYQVITNLLSNAVKYTGRQTQAVIEVWAEDDPRQWTLYVRDNGAGFDPRYAGKLFGIFQRLHRQEEFEGTGVGLINVRRIIARHGGRVFAHGRPGQGATFGFTLPKSV